MGDGNLLEFHVALQISDVLKIGRDGSNFEFGQVAVKRCRCTSVTSELIGGCGSHQRLVKPEIPGLQRDDVISLIAYLRSVQRCKIRNGCFIKVRQEKPVSRLIVLAIAGITDGRQVQPGGILPSLAIDKRPGIVILEHVQAVDEIIFLGGFVGIGLGGESHRAFRVDVDGDTAKAFLPGRSFGRFLIAGGGRNRGQHSQNE